MSISYLPTKWALSARIFHWLSVLLLFVTWVMIVLNKDADTFTYIDLHKAFGLSFLFWTIARIINRFLTKVPPNVPMPTWQIAIAHLTHFALYVLMLAMPLAGWLAIMYDGDAVNMFGLFNIPAFVVADDDKAHLFEKLHTDTIFPMLLLFTLAHVIGAIYHQFVQKDNLISRMK